MKLPEIFVRSSRGLALRWVAAVLVLSVVQSNGSNLTWSGGSGNWNTGQQTNFNEQWFDYDSGVFHGLAGTVNLTSGIVAEAVRIDTQGYVFQGNALTLQSLGFGVLASSVTFQNTVTLTQSHGFQSGTAIVSNANFHLTGSAAQDGGTVRLQNGGILSIDAYDAATRTSAWEFENGTVFLNNSTTIGRIQSLSNGAGVIASGNGFVTLWADIDSGTSSFSGQVINGVGTLRLVKGGEATLALSGNNSFTQGFEIAQGTVIAGSNNSLGAAGGWVMMRDGTTLTVDGNRALDYEFRVTSDTNSGTATFNTAGHDVSFTKLTGSATFQKTGAGKLQFTGDSRYDGTLRIAEGVFENAGILFLTKAPDGNILNNGNLGLGLGPGADMTVDGVISGTGAVGFDGLHTVTMNGHNTYSGESHIGQGIVQVNNGNALGTGTISMFSGTLRYGSGVSTDFSSRVGNYFSSTYHVDTNGQNVTWASNFGHPDATFTKLGTGTMTLSGSNAFGSVLIAGGSLRADGQNGLGSAGTISFANEGTLAWGTGNTTDYSSRFSQASGQSYRLDIGQGAVTFNTALNGAGTSLTKLGAGELVLNTANGLSGGVYLDGGVVTMRNTASLGSSGNTVHFRGGLLNVGTLGVVDANFSNDDNQQYKIQSVHHNEDIPGIVNPDFTIAQTLTSQGGTLELFGNGNVWVDNVNSYTGGTTIHGGILMLVHANSLGSGPLTLAGGDLVGVFTGDLSSIDLHVQNNGALFGQYGRTTTTSMDFAFRNVSVDQGATLTSKGYLSLTGTSAYAGHIDTHGFKNASGGIFQVGTGTSSTASLVIGTGTGAGSVNDGQLIFNSNATSTINGALHGTGSLEVRAGTVELKSTNAYSGLTYLNGGVAVAFVQGAFGSNAIHFDGGTLRAATDLSISNGLLIGSGGGTFDTNGHSVTANVLSGTGAFHKTGEGQLMLVGTSYIYNGDISVDQGAFRIFQNSTLQIGSGGTQGTLAGNIISDGNLVFNRSGMANYGGVISGTGSLRNIGPGTVTLTGANTYSGSTTIQNGTLEVSGSAGTLGLGHVRNDGNLAISRSGTYAMINAISGTGAVTISSGFVEFQNAVTYTGATQVNGGDLRVSADIASSVINIASGGTVDLHVASGVRDYNPAGGTVTFAGPGNLRKTGDGWAEWGTASAVFALSQGSIIDVQSGTFVGSSNANENWTNNQAALHVASGAVFHGVEGNIRVDALTGAGRIDSGFNGGGYQNFTFGVANGSGTFDGELADTAGGGFHGNFVKTGTGTQTLTGHNTYSGSTTIANGQLVVSGSAGTLGTGAVENNGVLTIARSGTYALTNNISGTGRVVYNGTGVVQVSGSNTYSHNRTLILSGDVHATNDVAMGLGGVGIDGGKLTVTGTWALATEVFISSGTYARTVRGSLAGQVAATSTLGGPDTTVKILDGHSATEETIVSRFSAATDATYSDIYHLEGMNNTAGRTELFALELSFSSIESEVILGWLNGEGQWVNARDGNFDNNINFASQYAGSFGQFQGEHGYDLNSYIGAWGFVEDAGVVSVWAVLNHNSDFAAVPEPSTWALLGLGAAGMWVMQRRRRRA